MIPPKVSKKEVLKKARKKWGELSADQSASQISFDQAAGVENEQKPNQTLNGTVLLDAKYLNAPSVVEPEVDASQVKTPVKDQVSTNETEKVELPPGFHEQLQEAVEHISSSQQRIALSPMVTTENKATAENDTKEEIQTTTVA